MAAPLGNKNAVKNRPWHEALNRALLAEDGKKLRQIAEKLIERALEGDVPALKEIGDRIDGKAIQMIVGPGDEGEHKSITRIEEVIIDPQR